MTSCNWLRILKVILNAGFGNFNKEKVSFLLNHRIFGRKSFFANSALHFGQTVISEEYSNNIVTG